MSRTPKIFLLLLFFLSLISVFIGRGFTAISPSWSDAQLFMYIGDQWLSGRIPYVDIWDNKPPGIFALIAFVFSIYPQSLIALAISEGVFILGYITTVYLLIRKVLRFWPAAILSAVSAALAGNLLFYNDYGLLTEIFMLWPATLSMLLFVVGINGRKIHYILMAGFSAGISSLFKTPGLSPLLAQISFVAVLVLYKHYRFGRALSLITAGLAGLFLAWLPAVLYFNSHGALADLFDATFFYNFSYGVSSQPGFHSIIMNLIDRLEPVSTLTVSAIIAFAIIVSDSLKSFKKTLIDEQSIRIDQSTWGILFILWMVADLAGVMAGGRYYPHYFLALIPSLSVLTGFFYSFVFRPKNQNTTIINNKALLAVMLIIIAPLFFQQMGDLRKLRWLIIDGPPKQDWQIVADRLNKLQEPDDTLFVWGYQPGIFYETGMKNAARLIDSHYFHDSERACIEFGKEVFDTIERSPPSFIVVRTSDILRQKRLISLFHELETFLNDSYKLIDVVGKLDIYRKSKSG